ncbi:PilZ domain-containing protein [Caminibacter mediatlanticus TB-2]|uniref:PilZ domain-containing protein n=1 Tax=Caminibacter mediatlanticus TB-2 TaxID=391592 RepID=A0AAI9AJA1_9BACT|nr:PilZ domain-containing protein [Caminibacter mediatlanticus]EDM24504.1 hypothetical protein CMTB2_03273 [Caminibacter mediatlanticus TB-2]QCT95150.1 PilZ domain-containing protein [Caminibacter mediatlanticus TB-2]
MNKFKNKFLENNFLDLLEEYKDFFEKYELNFVVNTLEIIKKKNSKFNITIEHKDFFKNLYKSFFIDKTFENFILQNTNILNEIRESHINLIEILDKAFLIMANAFIKNLIKEKYSIIKLKKLTSLFDFYLEYMNYHINEPIEFILNLPKEIKEYYLSNTKLYLLSVYKGVPISHSTHIFTINEDRKTIEVTANYYQIVAAKFNKNIYLLEPKNNKTFKATISEIYPKRKILELVNIEKVKRAYPKRNYIRVEPKYDIEVKILKNKKLEIGKMYDLSLKGISVLFNKKLDFEIGDILKIKFNLEIEYEDYSFTFDAELKSITKLNENNYRYHFYFEPNIQEEKILEKYIIKREKEIITELQTFLQQEIKNV